MAMPLIPVSLFPDVPSAPGVPAVFRSASSLAALGRGGSPALAVADLLNVYSAFSGPQWGIFTADGQVVASADSVISLDYRREWRISDYPLETGAFESYDKVQLPFDARVRFAIGNSVSGPFGFTANITAAGLNLSGPFGAGASFGPGGVSLTAPSLSRGLSSNRADFLAAIDAAASSLDLFTVVTPDATYESASIVHYDYRRDTHTGGPGILLVDVWLEEVRITAQSATAQSGQTAPAAPGTAPAQPTGAARSDGGTVGATTAEPSLQKDWGKGGAYTA